MKIIITENQLKKIKTFISESPDRINILNAKWFEVDTISFTLFNNEILIGYNENFFKRNHYTEWKKIKGTLMPKTHNGIYMFEKLLKDEHISKLNFDVPDFDDIRDETVCPGRLWYGRQLISFWEHPINVQQLNHILNRLSIRLKDVYNLDVNFYEEWMFENGDDVIPIKNYIKELNNGEINTEKNDLSQIHLLPPKEKEQTPQMIAARNSREKFFGKKFGKTPIAKYHHYTSMDEDDILSEN